jgi:hypothetical protein
VRSLLEQLSAAAEQQTRVNRACSNARFLRTAAAATFVLLVFSIINLVGSSVWKPKSF